MTLSHSYAVTTCVKPSQDVKDTAHRLAAELNLPYAPRRNVTVNRVILESGVARLVVVHPERWVLFDAATGTEYFYHPNMLIIRGLNVVRGQRELFLEATGLQPGDSLLDCTVGFGTEATLAAFLVGESGTVVGLESEPALAAVTRHGMAHFPLQTKVLKAAMQRVEVVTADSADYLRTCPDRSYDVVYFDPFFDEHLPGAESTVSPLALFGNPAPLNTDALQEARRVARRRVIVKHPRFASLPPPFEQQVSENIYTRKGRLVYRILEVSEPHPA